MSFTLDAILAQAARGLQTTVALSSESLAVLLYATGFLDQRRFWLDKGNDPEDEITDADWELILDLVAGLESDIMHPEIGAVFPFITADPPDNTLECDGTTYNRVDFPLLYAALDAAFVVDADTFIVPDLRSRVLVAAGEGSGLSNYNVADVGGEETHALSVAEMPAHNHALFEVSLIALTGEEPFLSPFVTSGARVTDYTGGNGAHENRQPYFALRYCVRCQ